VEAGTLLVNNTTGSGTGSGNVVVQTGATLGGTGSIAPAGGFGLTVDAGATLMVGTIGHTSASQFTVNLDSTGMPGFATLASGSTLKLNLFLNEGLTTNTEADRLVFSDVGSASQITISGATLNVTIGAGSSLVSTSFNTGDSWKLIDWGGLTPTGTFANLSGSSSYDFIDLPTLGAGKFWDISNLYTTGVIVVAVPEPGRLLLLLLGVLALGWRRRRRLAV
jgi:hypothetical protein